LPRATRSATDRCGTTAPGSRFLAAAAALCLAAAVWSVVLALVVVAIAVAFLSRYPNTA